MSAYHFNQRPLLNLDNVQCEIPHAVLWAAQTAVQWVEQFKHVSSKLSAIDAEPHY